VAGCPGVATISLPASSPARGASPWASPNNSRSRWTERPCCRGARPAGKTLQQCTGIDAYATDPATRLVAFTLAGGLSRRTGPAVGTANAEVTLWIAGLDGSRTEAGWDRGAFEYVPGAGWDAQGPYAVVQSRDQCTVRFLGIDPAGGETRVLTEQRDECWVQLIPGLPARTDSGALIAHADLQGTRHLTVNGAVVTRPGSPAQGRARRGRHERC
jgi:hypothetical protein